MNDEIFIHELPAWRGREEQISPLLRAWLLTKPDDFHKTKLSALLARCWTVSSFPTPDEYSDLIGKVAAEIRREVTRGPLPKDPTGRFLEILKFLRASVAAARTVEAPDGFSF
jgi:hypothetical protein